MTLHLQIAGRSHRVELPTPLPAAEFTCTLDGRNITLQAEYLQPGVLSLLIAGKSYRCYLDQGPEGRAVLLDGQRHSYAVEDPRSLNSRRTAARGADGPRAIKAPMPGRIVRILAEPGAVVEANQAIVVIEAMKMQNELKSPKAGRLARMAVAVGDTVQAGAILAVIE